MARIRSIKPDFFRHEGLQDLEKANPGNYTMLVFAGLWTLSDKLGQFEWKPRQIHLDLLPFITFEMEATLGLLEEAGLVARYEVCGKQYGVILTFKDHQRISGKENTDPPRFPSASPVLPKTMPREAVGNPEGSTGEALGTLRGSIFYNNK